MLWSLAFLLAEGYLSQSLSLLQLIRTINSDFPSHFLYDLRNYPLSKVFKQYFIYLFITALCIVLDPFTIHVSSRTVFQIFGMIHLVTCNCFPNLFLHFTCYVSQTILASFMSRSKIDLFNVDIADLPCVRSFVIVFTTLKKYLLSYSHPFSFLISFNSTFQIIRYLINVLSLESFQNCAPNFIHLSLWTNTNNHQTKKATSIICYYRFFNTIRGHIRFFFSRVDSI